MPGNEDPEMIYMMVQDQLIVGGMGGAVAINQMAIHAAMDLYEVADKKTCFEKVLMMYRAVLANERENKGD